MASAIWSASLDAIRSFPALTLVRFFDNHGLLSLHAQPTWKVVAGGSHTYMPRLVAQLSGDIHQGAAIQAVRRSEAGSRSPSATGPRCLRRGRVRLPRRSGAAAPRRPERSRARRVLALHDHDERRVAAHGRVGAAAQARARASWNYRLAGDADAPPTVTYDLNRLQGLTAPERYCVTLNPDGGIDERRVLRRFVYRHPLYTREAIGAQRQWGDVSGVNRTHYCGAYWLLRLPRRRVEFGAQGRPRARGRVVIDSGLFVGTLRHRRFTPVAHAFTYPLFMALLDVDRVPELMRVSRLTSHNRWNWASFDDRDHLGDPAARSGNGSPSTRRATGSSCRRAASSC